MMPFYTFSSLSLCLSSSSPSLGGLPLTPVYDSQPSLDERVAGYPSCRGHECSSRKTIQHLDIRAGMKVLDAGCGPGRLTILVSQIVGPCGEITAVDLQEGILSEAQEQAHAAPLANIRFLLAGIGDGKLESDRFDRAVLITVLGEIPDRDAALNEIFAALKPGGILLVEETIRDPHFQTRSTVTRLAGAAGFSEKDFFGNRFSYTLTLQKPSGT